MFTFQRNEAYFDYIDLNWNYFFLFILGFVTGLTELFDNKSNYTFCLFLEAQVLHILMSLFYIIYFIKPGNEIKGLWGFVYLITFFQIKIIYSFFLFVLFDSNLQLIITTFLVIILALISALILRGKRKKFNCSPFYYLVL